MKKILCISMALIMILSFTACNKKDEAPVTDDNAQASEETAPETATWIDDSFEELSYKVLSNWEKKKGTVNEYGGEVEYFLKDDEREIHISSVPELLSYYTSPEQLIKEQNKDDISDVDADDNEKIEIIKEEKWDNGTASGFMGIMKETDGNEVSTETTIAIFSEKTCYFIDYEVENDEGGISQEEFEEFLKTIKLK